MEKTTEKTIQTAVDKRGDNKFIAHGPQQFSIQNLTLQDVAEGNDRHPIRQRIGRLCASFHAQ